MENAVVSEYLISIKNGQVVTNDLPALIRVEGTTLHFMASKPFTVLLDMEIDGDLEVTYDIETQAQVELIETRKATCESRLIRHIHVGENAKLASLVLNESEATLEVSDDVKVEANANVESAYAELSLSTIKAKYGYDLVGEGANVEVKMAALSSNTDHKSFDISLNHLARYTYGQMDNYGVVKDQATLIFNGIGKIVKGMNQSSTHQTSKIIVFDPSTHAEANPYLYIDEYDVKASHAAGVGRMDEEHLFYMQSRGLTKHQAMRLITYGYLVPVIDVIDNQRVKDAFNEMLEKRMGD